jgi:hypothetical protein
MEKVRFTNGDLEVGPSGFPSVIQKMTLDMAVADRLREPPTGNDHAVALLQKRGQDDERRCAEELAGHRLNIGNLEDYQRKKRSDPP